MFNYHLGKCNKEQLEQDILHLKNIIKELKEEHKDSYTLIDHYKKHWEMAVDSMEYLRVDIDRLQKENEQLKKQLDKPVDDGLITEDDLIDHPRDTMNLKKENEALRNEIKSLREQHSEDEPLPQEECEKILKGIAGLSEENLGARIVYIPEPNLEPIFDSWGNKMIDENGNILSTSHVILKEEWVASIDQPVNSPKGEMIKVGKNKKKKK